MNGVVEGSAQVLSAEAFSLNSGGGATGDLLVPGTPRLILNGSARVGETVTGTGPESPTGWRITLNSGASVGRLVTRDTGGAIPAVSPPSFPAGTRDVAINAPSQEIGEFSTVRNLTLNSGAGPREIPPGTYGSFTANSGSSLVLGQAGSAARATYHFQRLALNSGSALKLVGPVEIVVATAVSLNAPMGEPHHPEWMECRIAAGGLTLNSPARFDGYVTAPHGAVVLNSQAVLTGGVQSDRLTLNSGSRLIALAAVQRPPELLITSPSAGSLVPAGVVQPVAIENHGGAAPSGAGLWVGEDSVGQLAVLPGSVDWLPDRLGVQRLQARAYPVNGDVVASPEVEVRVAASLPVVSGFASAEGFAVGPVAGQEGWEGAGEVYASQEDDWAIRLPAAPEAGWAAIYYSPDEPGAAVFAGGFIRPHAASSPSEGLVAEFAGAQVAFVRSSNPFEGEFMVLSVSDQTGAGGIWRRVDRPSPVSLDGEGRAANRVEVSFRYDHSTDRWDFHVDGLAVAADLKAPPFEEAHRRRLRFAGSAEGDTELDDVYVDRENRAFEDLDRDGIDDHWERYFGTDPTRDDRSDDADGDGLSNVVEYVLWTDPTLADSDGDGLSDALEHRLGLNPLEFTYPTDDDEDGRSQIEELQAGTDPTDFFDGTVPVLNVVSAPGDPDGLLIVQVSRPGGIPWPHAPVRFEAGAGGACFATNPDSTITHSEIELRSDEQGRVTVYIRRAATEENP